MLPKERHAASSREIARNHLRRLLAMEHTSRQAPRWAGGGAITDSDRDRIFEDPNGSEKERSVELPVENLARKKLKAHGRMQNDGQG